jgi:hypothetical protein
MRFRFTSLCPSDTFRRGATFITYDSRLISLVSRIFDHPALVDSAPYSWITQTGWSFWMRKL